MDTLSGSDLHLSGCLFIQNYTIQPSSRDVGTVDDGLTKKDTWVGVAPEDQLCDLVTYGSLPKSPLFLLFRLSLSFTAFFFLLFSVFRQHIFQRYQTFINIYITLYLHVSRNASVQCSVNQFLLFLCCLSIICWIPLLLRKQLINLLLPGASHLSPSISPPVFGSSACSSLYALCLFLYSLILPLDLSLDQMCVEYKLYREGMSCDIVFPLFTLIDVSYYLAYARSYWVWQHLINTLSIDTHH